MTNYAVTLEKLGKRTEALAILESLAKVIKNDARVLNNLGIIKKRTGDIQESENSYRSGLVHENENFFLNYNLGVLKAQTSENCSECLPYFEKALQIAET